jgi:SAM-dependent methyltransferase
LTRGASRPCHDVSATVSVLVRTVLNSANNFVAWMDRGQRADPGPRPVRVNLGSALAVAPGWIHVDASPNALLAGRSRAIQAIAYRFTGSNALFDLDEFRRRINEHRFVHHDLTYGIPFPDQSVDFLYSSHFLEHLERPTGLRLLLECYRVLRAGGVVRLCVPDLRKAVQFYLGGDRKRFLAYFFTDEREERHRHRYMYDFEILRDAMCDAGFIDVIPHEFRAGRTPDLDLLDNRSDETLYVEAARPA